MGGVAAGVFIGRNHEAGGEGQTKGRGVESGAAGRPPRAVIPSRPAADSVQRRSHPETHPGTSRETPVPSRVSDRGRLVADYISQ